MFTAGLLVLAELVDMELLTAEDNMAVLELLEVLNIGPLKLIVLFMKLDIDMLGVGLLETRLLKVVVLFEKLDMKMFGVGLLELKLVPVELPEPSDLASVDVEILVNVLKIDAVLLKLELPETEEFVSMLDAKEAEELRPLEDNELEVAFDVDITEVLELRILEVVGVVKKLSEGLAEELELELFDTEGVNEMLVIDADEELVFDMLKVDKLVTELADGITEEFKLGEGDIDTAEELRLELFNVIELVRMLDADVPCIVDDNDGNGAAVDVEMFTALDDKDTGTPGVELTTTPELKLVLVFQLPLDIKLVVVVVVVVVII